MIDVHSCKHFMIDMAEGLFAFGWLIAQINKYLCGGGSGSHSKDFILDNQIFIIVITIIVMQKWMSLSSLPVECGLSFSHAFWDVYEVHMILFHYN